MISTKRPKACSSPHQTSPSLSVATVVNNDDLLVQILLHLPVKSLLKFKCVSKHWLSIITNPQFSRRHYPVINSVCALFVQKFSHPRQPEFDFVDLHSNSSGAPFRFLTFSKDPSGIKITQSCNGLLLCSSYRANSYKTWYYVYNPTTKQFSALPRLRKASRVLGLTLAFDPWKSPDYKVVSVRKCDTSRHRCLIDIYSSRSGPWRVSGNPFTAATGNVKFNGVYSNGAIHWISDYGPSLYFDVDKEQLNQMPMPPIPDGWDRRRVMYFGECRGHLHLIENYSPPRDTPFDVCEMKKDYSGWVVKYRVDLDGVAKSFPEMARRYLDPFVLNYYSFQILSVIESGESDDYTFLVLHVPGKLIRYNLTDDSFKRLHVIGHGGDTDMEDENAENFTLIEAYKYIESLALV
ncbi:hypothetical protein K2173_027502 [Erythroxylum novogranatense]|uniref:F-box domain-containing protein n=1 Tax=Erythroxylum novogranatense TaxID=1862640 RepID=A0AAV8U1S4_9ROSI|nr:hypothetical protein K2173_027502 [Erythroxylum novogranatense]